MTNYLDHVPYYLIFNALGIVLNFINLDDRLRNNKERFTAKRVIKELFGMLWISLAVLGLLDYYTVLPPFLISVIASFAGYFHSKFIDFIGNDLLIFLGKLLKNWLSKIVLGKETEEQKIKRIEESNEKEINRCREINDIEVNDVEIITKEDLNIQENDNELRSL